MTERNFVIKIEHGFGYVREAERDYRDGTVNYRHAGDAPVLLAGAVNDPSFWGKFATLDAQLGLEREIANLNQICQAAENKLGTALDASIQAEREAESDMEKDRR